MKVKAITDEDFVNYKKPCMFISTCFCDWKCCHEANISESVCQNNGLVRMRTVDMSADEIFRRYINNPISESVVIAGLEPVKQFDEIYELIKYFRENNCDDMFVIYTGYYPEEIKESINELTKLKNITFKFGRYIPNQASHYDNILGVELASNNQYGKVIC